MDRESSEKRRGSILRNKQDSSFKKNVQPTTIANSVKFRDHNHEH